MKVLSIEQMTKLKELGVDVEPNGLDFMYSAVVLDEYRLMYAESVCEDDMKAFTLQDVIDLLPYKISTITDDYVLSIAKSEMSYIFQYCVEFEYNFTSIKVSICLECILDAAYNMLIWVIENGHLKTN